MQGVGERSQRSFWPTYLPLALQRAKKLIHLLYPALDALGGADFSSTAQGLCLPDQILAMARGPSIHAGAFVRPGRIAGWSFALCSHESLPLTGKRHFKL